jgi:spore germination cell wall hydrolase CwlJ-like protein
MTPDDVATVARTLYGEARGEGLYGMLAVACVIRNRVKHPTVRWWGAGWAGVCLAPRQFSCWNPGDPSLGQARYAEITSDLLAVPAVAARAVMFEDCPDVTNGADYYHSIRVYPAWARGKDLAAAYGWHRFYRLAPR